MFWPAMRRAGAGTGAGLPAPAPRAAGGRGARPRRGARAVDPAVFEKTFPGSTRKDNARIRMLWIVCGTADSLIGVNRQFKDWLRSKGVQFTEQEVPDVGHVWPLWRQNVADMVPRLFVK